MPLQGMVWCARTLLVPQYDTLRRIFRSRLLGLGRCVLCLILLCAHAKVDLQAPLVRPPNLHLMFWPSSCGGSEM